MRALSGQNKSAYSSSTCSRSVSVTFRRSLARTAAAKHDESAATRADLPQSSSPTPTPRPIAALATAALAAAAAVSAAAPLEVLAKPNTLLDVPACTKKLQLSPASGVRFCEVKEGSGDSPQPGDLVVVDYTARALAAGGRVFDGSTGFKFFVGEKDLTIPGGGFDVALLGDGGALGPIKEGGVRTVVLPSALAFGESGDGCLYGRDESCRIPPNSEVELTFRYRGLGY